MDECTVRKNGIMGSFLLEKRSHMGIITVCGFQPVRELREFGIEGRTGGTRCQAQHLQKDRPWISADSSLSCSSQRTGSAQVEATTAPQEKGRYE
jgi:hypothetical protein